MKNEFDTRIKSIEQELLDLKTASEYSSIKNSTVTQSQLVDTGNYRITYDNNGGEIISSVFANDPSTGHFPQLFVLAPSGNSQIVQIDATWRDYDDPSGGAYGVPVYFSVRLTVVSNYPITSITKIS